MTLVYFVDDNNSASTSSVVYIVLMLVNKQVKHLAGTGKAESTRPDGVGTEAGFWYPRYVYLDSTKENIYISSNQNTPIRKYNIATGQVSTVNHTQNTNVKWIQVIGNNLYYTDNTNKLTKRDMTTDTESYVAEIGSFKCWSIIS